MHITRDRCDLRFEPQHGHGNKGLECVDCLNPPPWGECHPPLCCPTGRGPPYSKTRISSNGPGGFKRLFGKQTCAKTPVSQRGVSKQKPWKRLGSSMILHFSRSIFFYTHNMYFGLEFQQPARPPIVRFCHRLTSTTILSGLRWRTPEWGPRGQGQRAARGPRPFLHREGGPLLGLHLQGLPLPRPPQKGGSHMPDEMSEC